MAQNYIFTGERVEWVNDSGDDVVSGQPVQIGNMSGIAGVNILDGESGTVMLEGVFELPRASAVGMPSPGTRMYALADGTVTTDAAAAGAFYIGVSHSEDTRDAATNVQILLQNEGSAPVVAGVVAPLGAASYTAVPGSFADVAAVHTYLLTHVSELNTRDTATEGKINAIITALQTAGLMAS